LTHQVPLTFKILILKVRGADASVKPGAWAPGWLKEKRSKPAQRAAAEIIWRMLSPTAITRFAGSIDILVLDLGLTPQALRWRPLRGLKTTWCVKYVNALCEPWVNAPKGDPAPQERQESPSNQTVMNSLSPLRGSQI